MTPDRDSARKALAIYEELSAVSDRIKSLRSDKERNLQKVQFYLSTAFYSGPTEYTPRHLRGHISEWIIRDMEIEQTVLCSQLQDLGFDPKVPT